MKTVHWGIIGCGDVCEKKAGPALYGVDRSELVAVMRRTSDKAEDYARRHGVAKWYDRVEELLADDEIDTIYVATPDEAHEEGTIAAARAGKDVLVEKAMATDTAACNRMIDVCDNQGVVLAVAYYRRGYPTILRAKELIDQGAIGAVKTITLNDEFPLSHRLDLVHFFAGDVEAVWAKPEPLPPGSHAEHGDVLYCRTLAGPIGITPAGWEEKLAPETVLIEGETGSVHVTDLKKGTLSVTMDNVTKEEDLGPLPATHWGIVDNFVKHVNGLAPLACDGVEGRKSTVILDIVKQLQADGKEVPVDYS
jgi:predicted dehydrogenase